MTKKYLAIVLVALMILGAAIPALAANSLDALKALVPASAVMFNANGASTNGHSGPEIIWWDYDNVAKTGTVYLIVANAQSGKVAKGATIGSTAGSIIDSYAPGGNATAYTLIKFSNVWLYGDELLSVDLGAGGQNMNGKVSDYFPQLKNITYWDGDAKLGSDTQLSGTTVKIWDISYLPNVPTGFEFLGWSYVKNAAAADMVGGDDIILGDDDIDLYAVWGKDLSQTKDLVYTVEYTLDGVFEESYTVTKKVWIIEDLATFTVTPDAISAANDRYVGYKLASDPFVAPTAVKNGDVITVPYIKDASQTRDVVYTVKYTLDGTEVAADTYEVTVKVWINEPADIAVPVAAISAANNRYVGYKLASDPFTAPATAQNGDVITVPYIKDVNWTKVLSYTVEYYKVDVLVAEETVSETVWVNDPDTLTVLPVDENKFKPEYEFDYTVPATLPATIEDGGLIQVYYKKMIFTVTFAPGEQGAFDEVTHEGLYYGVATPAAPVALANPGWEFTGWEPEVAATVTEDIIYTAQWYHIPYTVTFLPGAHGDFEAVTFSPVYYGEDMPAPPQPYAEFSYKFLGWQGDDGSFYAAPDYRHPSILDSFPETVSGSVTFTAQWALVNPNQQFPDRIPSVSHVDRWWNDYGILCYAASNGDTPYFVGFAEWFFEVYRTVGVGFGTSGNWEYVVAFTADNAVWVSGNSGAMVGSELVKIPFAFTNALDSRDAYGIHENVVFDASYSNNGNKNTNFGALTGIWFDDPFVTGAKQAWLGTLSDLLVGGNPVITYTVTYAPGAHGDFAAQTFSNLSLASATPLFVGEPLSDNTDWVFADWSPAVSSTVNANVTYTALWKFIGEIKPQPRTFNNLSNKGKAGAVFTHGSYVAAASGELLVRVTALDKNMAIKVTLLENGAEVMNNTFSASGGVLQYNAEAGLTYSVKVEIVSANGNSSYTISVIVP